MRNVNGTTDAIRKLMQAHLQGDEGMFRAVAWEIVERERRLNHHTFANDLERLLSDVPGDMPSRQDVLGVFTPSNGNLPKDRERNASLVELREPNRKFDDLIVTPELRMSLDRLVLERRKSDILRSHGTSPIAKVLFCGPPGCGKSMAAEVLASELYLPLATVRFDAVVSS